MNFCLDANLSDTVNSTYTWYNKKKKHTGHIQLSNKVHFYIQFSKTLDDLHALTFKIRENYWPAITTYDAIIICNWQTLICSFDTAHFRCTKWYSLAGDFSITVQGHIITVFSCTICDCGIIICSPTSLWLIWQLVGSYKLKGKWGILLRKILEKISKRQNWKVIRL